MLANPKTEKELNAIELICSCLSCRYENFIPYTLNKISDELMVEVLPILESKKEKIIDTGNKIIKTAKGILNNPDAVYSVGCLSLIVDLDKATANFYAGFAEVPNNETRFMFSISEVFLDEINEGLAASDRELIFPGNHTSPDLAANEFNEQTFEYQVVATFFINKDTKAE